MNVEAAPVDWRVGEAEHRLLEFLASLILDVGRTHPRITQEQVALWLARVVVGRWRTRR